MHFPSKNYGAVFALANYEIWMNVSKKTIRILDDLFLYFCRTIFRISAGCPKPSFYWESGSLTFENLILEKKLNFLFHLANLPISSLGRQFFDLQDEDRSLPSILQECQEHLDKIGLNLKEVSKGQFKKKTKQYIMRRNKNQLLENIKDYKKLSYNELSSEPFERKSYFSNLSLSKARMRFRIASSYVQTVRGNFSRKYRNKSMACPGCSNSDPPAPATSSQSQPRDSKDALVDQSQRDTQSHLLECVAYSDLRVSLEQDPMNDEKLADFFYQSSTKKSREWR